MSKKTFDFSGYATRVDLKCSDGAIIREDAFKHQNGETVPLVWQHLHNGPENILGHAMLEHRKDGVYAYASFNDSEQGRNAKELVRHGDVKALSIYANKLVRRGVDVLHGAIREVSLVLSGANPGAYIDNVVIAHGDSYETSEDEAIIYTGLSFEIQAETIEHADDSKEPDMAEKTVGDIFETLTEEQKNVVYYMIGEALSEAGADDEAEHSAFYENDDYISHNDGEETITMTRNVFESLAHGTPMDEGLTLSHSDIKSIFADGERKNSLKEAVIAHATTYGIENIDMLFPDAQTIGNRPEFIKRRTEWVASVLTDTHHSPFSRIKTILADITEDDARAKGYIKASMKKEEWFTLAKRVTTPQTVYKKQKLDRNDILDITDFDVVIWVKEEMRLMLDEEIAAAALVGDGRSAGDPDKIKSPSPTADGEGIRAIALDASYYAYKVEWDAADADDVPFVDRVMTSLVDYTGSGSPKLYTSPQILAGLLVERDTLGRRMYSSRAELATAMGVSAIVDIPASILARANFQTTAGAVTTTHSLKGIVANLRDYTFGSDAGGKTTLFDDFDIDFNQQKYLLEARLSGTLTKPFSAATLWENSVN
jgi:hypothetical protein